MTDEKKRELEHNAEETYDENVCVGCILCVARVCMRVHLYVRVCVCRRYVYTVG